MDNSNIKVIISDLDGTLLNTKHKISNFTKKVFQELHRQNYLIIIATGRHHLDAMSIIKDLDFPVYLVTSNGARIHSPSKEILFSVDMKSENIQSVFNLDINPEITIVLFKENVWQTNQNNELLNSFQSEMNYQSEIVNFNKEKELSAIKLFFTHEDHQVLVALKEQILETHSDVFNYAFSLPFCLEFMDKSVDKSIAIARILEKENFTFQDTISFGDGFNDENMLKSTKKGMIMQNAPDALKNKLSHLEVILSNNQDGVAKYLEKMILLNN